MTLPPSSPLAKPDYKACAGYLKRQWGVHEFNDSVKALQYEDTYWPDSPHVFDLRWADKVGAYIVDRERNEMGEWFCSHEEDVTKALMLDDDHSFTPQQAYELLALCGPERPVVSGLYFAVHSHNKEHPYVRPLIFNYEQNEDGTPDRNAYRTNYSFPRNSLVAVDQIGLGFCAVWIPMLRKWRKKFGPTWFDYGRRPNGKRTLEDEGFCRKVRDEMGLPIYVHTGIIVKHWKPWGIDLEFFENQTAGYEKRSGLLIPAPPKPDEPIALRIGDQTINAQPL